MAIQTKENPLKLAAPSRIAILVIALLPFSAPHRSSAQPEDEEELFFEFSPAEPQFFVDSYWILRRANEEGSAQAVPFTFHSPTFRSAPLLVADEPWEASGIGHFSVLYDGWEDRYRLYYEVENPLSGQAGFPPSKYLIACAESEDGLAWIKPELDLIAWGDRTETNLLFEGEEEARFPHVHVRSEPDREGPRNLGDLPSGAFDGSRYLMTYRDSRQRFASSEDGLHWREDSEGMLRYRTESYLTLSRNEREKKFESFLTAGLVHELPGPVGRWGFARWVARLSNPTLSGYWDRWMGLSRLSGKAESTRIDSLKAFRYGGVNWGLVEFHREDPPRLEVELATSRQGLDWHFPKDRPTLIPADATAAWGGNRVQAADRVLEDGEDWRLYYSFSGGEGSAKSGIGLATFSAERVISIRADETGRTSYLETQPLLWPGGNLFLNAESSNGSIEAQVKSVEGDPLPGFSFEESIPLGQDARRMKVEWKESDMEELKNEVIRIEFRFTHAELFAFLAER